jgi:pimeloyl-ACP methyl ester carboxylesterase
MHVCKAYYRQVRGLTEDQIRRLGTATATAAATTSGGAGSGGGGSGAPAAVAAAAPAVPVWVMHGDADGVLPLAGAEALHAALGPAAQHSPLRTVAGASHNFLIERPAELVALLREVAAAVSSSTS